MAIGTVPRSFRLAPVAKYIIDGKSARAARCRLAIWGDSIQEWSNGISGGASYSMGMRNTWKCNWLGAAIHPDAGTDDIVGKHSNLAGAFGSGWSGYSDPVPAISAWAPSTLYALNAIRAPLTPNDFAYKVTSGGTTGSSEPAWPTEIGATVTDGGVTWTAYQLIGNYYPIAAPTKSPSFTPVAVLKTNKNTPDTTGFGTLGLLQVNAQNVKQFHFTGDWTTRALNVSAILYHHPLGMNGSGNGGADSPPLRALR